MSTWEEANATCQTMSAHLPSIHSREEADFVHRLNTGPTIENYYIAWLGGKRVQGYLFKWTDGTNFDFAYWQPNEPSNVNPANVSICAETN